MSKSNTLFQHPVYIACNSIIELLVRYEDFDADSHNDLEVEQDLEALEYLYHNIDDIIKKPAYEQLKRQMNNALEELADKNTEYFKGTDY